MARTPDMVAENFAAADAFASPPAGVGVEVGRAERRPFILFRGPWWIVMVAAGLATVAACVLLPLREENRALAHQLAEVQQEADFVSPPDCGERRVPQADPRRPGPRRAGCHADD